MPASLARRSYRVLVGLYPTAFRREYGQDLVLLFDDLVADRGTAAATVRTGIDLFVTVPRYHLEAVMTASRATRTHNAGLVAVPLLGAIALIAGLPWIGGLLVLTGAALLIVNRGRLAASIRTPDTAQRNHRFRMAALSAGIFAVCAVGYLIVISDGQASSLGLLATSLPGMTALIAAVTYLGAGLATPRSTATA